MKSIIFTIMTLLFSASLSAQDANQTIQLEDGTWVRYFTLDQARELADRLLEGEQCSDNILLREEQLSLREDQVKELQSALELSQAQLDVHLEYEESLDATIDDLFDRIERRNRFLFCSSPACTYSIGFVFGVGATVAVVLAVN